MVLVDLEGVEPSSKQGNNKLSTCLSSLRFSCVGKTKATNPRLILFISFRLQGRPELSSIYPHFLIIGLEATAAGKCLVSVPCTGIKFNLLYSIKQQERSYFRQLVVWDPRFTSRFLNARHAYISVLPAVKTKQPLIVIIYLIISNKTTIKLRTSNKLVTNMFFIYNCWFMLQR